MEKKKKINGTELAMIWENRSKINSLEQGMKYLEKSFEEIKNNHLAHIQTSLNEMGKELTEVKLQIRERSPMYKLFSKIVEYIVLAVIMGALAFSSKV